MNCAHCQKLVDAFIDSEIDAGTAESMRAHMAKCPECSGAIEDRRALRAMIRRGGIDESVPDDVAVRVRRALRATRPPLASRRRPTWPQTFGLAGATAAFAVATTLALMKGPARDDVMLRTLVDRHVVGLETVPGHGLPALQLASQERHKLKPWFQGRVALSPPVVDLSSQGIELLGGRVERVGSADAAVVVYRLRRHPIDLFAWRDELPAQAPRAETKHGFNVVRWRAGGLSYAAVSDLNRAELGQFARAVSDAQ